MATKKLRSVKGRRIRLTALDECGAPDLTNPCGSIVTSGFVSVSWSDELETGEEYTQKNAWGDFCIAEKDADRVKWTNVTISLCEIDPQILVMLGGAIPNLDTQGHIVGAFFTRDPNPLSFAIEVWTKKAGTDACAAASGGAPAAVEWGYFAGFNVRNGMLDGDLTIENAPLALNIKGELYGANGAWGVGPYGDNPLENVTGAPEGALRYIGTTTVQPPDDTDGCVHLDADQLGSSDDARRACRRYPGDRGFSADGVGVGRVRDARRRLEGPLVQHCLGGRGSHLIGVYQCPTLTPSIRPMMS
jgi:hypothetical protein